MSRWELLGPTEVSSFLKREEGRGKESRGRSSGQTKQKLGSRSSGRVTKKGPTEDFSFLFLQKKKKFVFQTWAIFSYQTKKEVWPPDWPQIRPPAGPETEGFLVWPHAMCLIKGNREMQLMWVNINFILANSDIMRNTYDNCLVLAIGEM